MLGIRSCATAPAARYRAIPLILFTVLLGGCGTSVPQLLVNPGPQDTTDPDPQEPSNPDPPGTEGLSAVGENCDDAADWDDTSMQFEEEVLALVNEHRAAGAVCGGTAYEATHALTMYADLRCAARRHSRDMALRDFFDHTNPDGDGPGERIAETGYSPSTWGENIAWGQPTPEAVVAAWMNSPGHCTNIMRPAFTEIGIGHHIEGLWTQVFASPSGR